VRLARGLAILVLGTAAASIGLVTAMRWLPVPLTSFMIHERAALRAGGIPIVQRHDWVPWAQMPRHAALAVIAAEDQTFFFHDGFDFAAIEKAVADARNGRRLRGASTITQQVAKNLFLWPGPSWLRKSLEAWFTLWIEILWPKQRILEVYLNSAQFGRGVWGIEAASRSYFGKRTSGLDAREAALLAAVLPSPTRFLVSRPSPYVLRRQAWILGQMQRLPRTRLVEDLY
jgi:monofunctional biosynthetic peptidoglycan transglycosylase